MGQERQEWRLVLRIPEVVACVDGSGIGSGGEEQIEWALQEGALHVQGRLTDALL